MKFWHPWTPRNCWLNPDADDSIAFACCMVNLGYCVLGAVIALKVYLLFRLVF